MATAMKKRNIETNELDLNNEVINEPVSVLTEPVVKKRVYKAEDPIRCISITAGELRMKGIKSGINYIWAGRNDVTEVEYQDLVAAIRSSKKQIFLPRFIIDDEELVAQFPQVEKIYKNLFNYNDLKDVFNLTPAQMKQAIRNLPEGARNSIRSIAATEIAAGRLDSVQKIKALDEIFDTKFMLMTELFNE